MNKMQIHMLAAQEIAAGIDRPRAWVSPPSIEDLKLQFEHWSVVRDHETGLIGFAAQDDNGEIRTFGARLC